jgi:glycosyltransferase involved in cell wall biosynthesis
MYVVLYLYNNNGMATWCWEAAHALAEAGEPVTLVCQPGLALPGTPDPHIRLLWEKDVSNTFRGQRKNVFTVLALLWERISLRQNELVCQVYEHLQAEGTEIAAIFSNQSDYFDPSVPVPQFTTAWSYPVSFWSYVGKFRSYNGWLAPGIKGKFLKLLWLINWWRTDWKAFRQATGILTVSSQLHRHLQDKGMKISHVVNPGSRVQASYVPEVHTGELRLITACLNLEDARKNIRWMLEALIRYVPQGHTFTLVGEASPAFREWASQTGLKLVLTGKLPREEVVALMQQHDVFLFASGMDDWGYVQVEAMGQGLVVVAPAREPFIEIVGDSGYLYQPDDAADFARKIQMLIREDVSTKKRQSWERAYQLFSRKVFAEKLLRLTRKETAVAEQA